MMFNLCLLKHGDASSLRRVYLKDLHVTKIINGTDVQVQHTHFASNVNTDLGNIVKYQNAMSLCCNCVCLGICCRVLQPWQVFPSCPKPRYAGSSAKHQHRASENVQLPISDDICTLCWRGLRSSVLLWSGEQRPSVAICQETQVLVCTVVQWLCHLYLSLFSMCRDGTEAWSRLWLLTRRWPVSFTLTLAMKRMSLWTGSSPWLLISSHLVHAWVNIHNTH